MRSSGVMRLYYYYSASPSDSHSLYTDINEPGKTGA
jgi:hypothetical protein